MEFVLAFALTTASVAGLLAAPLLLRGARLRRIALAFATGTLLTVVLVHVLPEALAGARSGALLFLAGFVAMMLVHQHVLKADPCCGHEHVQHAALPSFLALGLCSLNDGVLLAADRDHGLASPLLWALVVHKATAAFALFTILREVARPRPVLFWIYLGAFVVISPVTFLATSQVSSVDTVMPHLLALAGGALLYVVAGSMVPQVEHLAREDFAAVVLAFLLAVALGVGMQTQTGHAHAPSGPGASVAPAGADGGPLPAGPGRR